MIEVFIVHDGEPLGHIEIKNVTPADKPTWDEFADYTVRYGVDRGTAVGVHSRVLYGFPRKYYNVFALVLQALNSLDEKELKLERDYDIDSPEAAVSSDLARRLSGVVREIQAGFSRLHRD